MKYTTDGKFEVYAGKKIIAKSFVGLNGIEVRIRQGMNRQQVINKIVIDCPAFCAANNINEAYYPKLF